MRTGLLFSPGEKGANAPGYMKGNKMTNTKARNIGILIRWILISGILSTLTNDTHVLPSLSSFFTFVFVILVIVLVTGTAAN